MKHKKFIEDLEPGDVIIQSKSQLKYIQSISKYNDDYPTLIIKFLVLNFSNNNKPLYLQAMYSKKDRLKSVQWELLFE